MRHIVGHTPQENTMNKVPEKGASGHQTLIVTHCTSSQIVVVLVGVIVLVRCKEGIQQNG